MSPSEENKLRRILADLINNRPNSIKFKNAKEKAIDFLASPPKNNFNESQAGDFPSQDFWVSLEQERQLRKK